MPRGQCLCIAIGTRIHAPEFSQLMKSSKTTCPFSRLILIFSSSIQLMGQILTPQWLCPAIRPMDSCTATIARKLKTCTALADGPGTLTFRLALPFFFRIVPSTSPMLGALQEMIFCCEGKPCTNICDPRSAHLQASPSGMSCYLLGPQTSDDQGVWLQLLESVVVSKLIRNWAAGKQHHIRFRVTVC